MKETRACVCLRQGDATLQQPVPLHATAATNRLIAANVAQFRGRKKKEKTA